MRHWMAIGHNGEAVHFSSKTARAGLLEELGAKTAQKQYVDDKSGKSWHTGYIVKKTWYTIYEVVPMRRPA